MVGISPFCLFCTILVVCFCDFVLSNNETKTVESDKLDASIQFDKIYQYSVKQESLIKGYDLQPPINYRLTKNDTLMLVPNEKFCKPVQGIDLCNNFQALKENQLSHNGIKIQSVNDIRTKINDDSTIAFTLKVLSQNRTIHDETIVLINIKVPCTDSNGAFTNQNTSLVFEKPAYNIDVAYGRKGAVYKFTACFNNTSQNLKTNCNDQMNVTYALVEKCSQCTDYPSQMTSRLSISHNGFLVINSDINEGIYEFLVEAKYNGEESGITAQATVTLVVDNVAVCEKDDINFVMAYKKINVDENTMSTVHKNFQQNCSLRIAKCHPDAVKCNFEVNNCEITIKEGLDRESAIFYDDPSVYLKISWGAKESGGNDDNRGPLFPQWVENMPYDPHSTVLQVVINDVNDNPPVFPEKHIVVGYPVAEVALEVSPEHLVQVKAIDNDFGENANITYSLKNHSDQGFLIDPATGIVYCNHPVYGNGVVENFTVTANNSVKAANGEDMMSELLVTVKYFSYEHMAQVRVKFNVGEYLDVLERQLSDITGWTVTVVSSKIINGETGEGLGVSLQRTMIVYGMDNGTLVHGSDMEKKLKGNGKILEVVTYYHHKDTPDEESNTGTSVLLTLMVCIVVSAVALGVLFYGFIKNGRYMMFISNLATTPLKDDVENMSQSSWITTFDLANHHHQTSPRPSSTTLQLSGKNGESTSRSSGQYFPDVDQLEIKPTFEDDLFSFDKIEEDDQHQIGGFDDDNNFADFSRMR